jgi:hypothetical protein
MMNLFILAAATVALINLQVVNETGKTIKKLYLGEEDRLPVMLANHESTTIQIKPDKYQMVLVFDHSEIKWKDFDLTKVFRITFQKVGHGINAHYEFNN